MGVNLAASRELLHLPPSEGLVDGQVLSVVCTGVVIGSFWPNAVHVMCWQPASHALLYRIHSKEGTWWRQATALIMALWSTSLAPTRSMNCRDLLTCFVRMDSGQTHSLLVNVSWTYVSRICFHHCAGSIVFHLPWRQDRWVDHFFFFKQWKLLTKHYVLFQSFVIKRLWLDDLAFFAHLGQFLVQRLM